MDVLQALAGITSILDAGTYVILIDRHAELLERHADHPSGPQVFAAIATISANVLGRRREALALAEQCVALTRASGGPTHRVAFQHASLQVWSGNLLALADTYAELIEQSLAAGDVELAEYAWMMRLELAFYGGLHLRTLAELIDAWGHWSAQWGNRSSETGLAKVCARLLDGPAPKPGELDPIAGGGSFARGLGQLELLVGKLLAGVLLGVFGRWREAGLTLAALGDGLVRLLPGLWFDFMIPLFAGVAAAVSAGDRTLPARERLRQRRRLARRRRQLARMCAGGANFAHGELLLRGESRRLAGDFAGASKLLLAARERAAAQHNPWFEGLICERLAATMIEQGLERFGLAAIHDARECWLRWGAFAKVAALDEQWSQLAGRLEHGHTLAALPDSSSSTSRALDGATLLAASQAIAEDLELDEVLVRVMRLAVENVGAERGVLVLAHDGKLALAAEYHAEGERAELLTPAQQLADASERVPTQLLRWVARTGEAVVHDGTRVDMRFVADGYLAAGDRSILCAPIIKRGALIGLIYLENLLSTAAFTEARLEMLDLLAAQAGNAIDNARLYAELRASEVRWRSLVEQLPDYVAIAERDGTLTPVSSTLGDHHPPAPMFDGDPGELERALAYVYATGGRCEFELGAAPQPVDREASPHAGREDELCFVVRVGPLAADGKVERALIVATDVSERRRAEQAQLRYEAQLRAQQRLEAIGTLASGVAHEINNPIQGIMNYAELIGGSNGADAFVRELAGEIEHEGKRVAAIIRNLLAFARQERGQDEPFLRTPICEIVEETLSLVRSMLRRDTIDLRVELPDALPPVRCRSQQIQQVLLNLVTNARDALNARFPGEHPNKRIEITAGPVRRDDEDWVRLSVSDRGGGVPEQVVGRIFDPFFTTKGRDRGTGLGLALSHGIVAEHGGVLRLDNHPGEGACFSIELHAADSSRPQISVAAIR
jgi:signal transduction histidine kinase